MVELITECARKIEELLARSGELNILSICDQLAERSMVGYQALGWLAHEGRIHYRKQGSQVYVSLEGHVSPGDTRYQPPEHAGR